MPKRFNWKARKQVNVSIEEPISQIVVNLSEDKSSHYDESNPLILPSKKRKTKVQTEQTTKKLLSKKQRKRLEQIVKQREKKDKRAELIESLTQIQTPPELLKKLTSITTVQTKGIKRFQQQQNETVKKFPKEEEEGEEEEEENFNDDSGEEEEVKPKELVQTLSKKARKQRLALLANRNVQEQKKDPNIVGFEESSSDSEEEDAAKKDGDHPQMEKKDSIEDNFILNKKNNEKKKKENLIKKRKLKDIDISEKKIKKKRLKKEEKKKEEKHNEKNDPELKKEKKSLKKEKEEKKTPNFLNRPPEVIASRACLPIIAEEQTIVEAVFENPVVIVCGDTGSGKTTQLPQFLYEAGVDRRIAITQPRRVAATAMARRVAYETGLGCPIVAHSIRYESTITPETRIAFMTDGVLLKEIQSDPLLTRYSVIILDEAHERTLYTDVLLGLLSRLIPLRFKRNDPLRLVVMSATLRVEDFVENSYLFKTPPPIIKVEARQYPVSLHWARFTQEDYIRAAYRKVCRIHAELPEGAILVFLTGQQEIQQLVRKLRNTFPYGENKKEIANANIEQNKKENDENMNGLDDEDQFEEALLARVLKAKKSKRGDLPDQRRKNKKEVEKDNKNILPPVELDAFSSWEDLEQELEEEELNDDDVDDEEQAWLDTEMSKAKTKQPLWVLPLYSLLPSHKQNKVFEPPPKGCRLCVVATNVAETSLTIPGVKYVVDSGRCKQPVWDTRTGAQAMQIKWTSQASAEQRQGRAGRTAPGHCYRLYSSAVYADVMPKHMAPEITQRPVEHLILQVKSFGIARMETFPFPTPLPLKNLEEAERRLILLGALEIFESKSNLKCSKLTALGRTMSLLSVSPGHARLLAIAGAHGRRIAELALCLVASLAVSQLFTDDASAARAAWGKNDVSTRALLGDALISLCALREAEIEVYKNGNLQAFCTKYGIRMSALKEARLLRRHITRELNSIAPELELFVDPNMPQPNIGETIILRQLLLTALVDRIARHDNSTPGAKSYTYQCLEMEEPVLLHASCIFRGRKPLPEWIVYHELFETQPLPSDGDLKPKAKLYLRGVVAIEPEWLPEYVAPLCRLSEPLADPSPRWDSSEGVVKAWVSGTIGQAAYSLPMTEITLATGSPERYKWFARFFLEGLVCPALEKFKNELITTPSVMVKAWAKLQPRNLTFYQTLVNKNVDCRKKLIEIWKEDEKYLLQEYLRWLPEILHQKIVKIWPPSATS